MGSGSKSPSAPVDLFYMSAHYGICQGPVDVVKEISIKDKSAWRGRVTDNDTINISSPSLFGGLTKEGGVEGVVDVMMGGPYQFASPWLANKLGRPLEKMPAYRGMLSLVFRGSSQPGFYWTASTPYLGSMWVKVGRYPSQLDPLTAKVPRVSEGYLSVLMILDNTTTMTGEQRAAIKSAAKQILDVIGMRGKVYVGLGSFVSPSDEKAELETIEEVQFRINNLKDQVDDLPFVQDPSVLPILGGVSGVADSMMSWHDPSATFRDETRRFTILLTGANPVLDWESGGEAVAPMRDGTGEYEDYPVQMFVVNIENPDTDKSSLFDNTPWDGVPSSNGDAPDALMAALYNTLVSDEYDANPAHVIYECLTNTDWGLGWQTSSIDIAAFQEAATKLYAEEFGISLMWTQSASVEEFINDILDCIKGSVFTNPRTGKLSIRLSRDDYDVETLRVITPDNAKLRNFSRKAWGETTNEMKVTWTNPVSENEETVYAQDLGNIAMQGAVVSDSKNYHMVRKIELAQRLANRELRQASAPLCACEATVDRSMWDITPFECVKVNWPDYGLNNTVMRVVNVNYGRTGDSAVRLSLVEDIFGLPDATYVPPATGQWVDPNVPSAPISRARIMPTPPYMVAQNVGDLDQLMYPETASSLLVAAPVGARIQDYVIEVSEPTPTGGTQWVPVGQPRTFLGRGLLAAEMHKAASSTIPALTSQTGRVPEVNAFVVIGPDNAAPEELEIALVTAVDVDTGEVSLMRGVLDTVPKLWPAGTPVWIGMTSDFSPVPMDLIHGQSVQIRVRGESPAGGGTSPITFNGTAKARPTKPLRPANVKVNGIAFEEGGVLAGGSLVFAWDHRNRLIEDTQVLSWTASSVTIEPGVQYTVEADALDIDGAVIQANWYSASAGTGTTHTVNLTGLTLPLNTAQLRFRVVAIRDTERNWQSYPLVVNVMVPPSELTVEYVEVFAPSDLTITYLES